MKSGTVVAMILAAAAAGVAAWVATRGERAASTSSAAKPSVLFPDLKAKVNDVTTITIKHGTNEFTLQRQADAWGLQEKGGFPVRFENVKGAVVGLADLKPVEAKTSKPDSYAKIGVQDPDGKAPDAANPDAPAATTPTLVTLKDAGGNTLASLIVGTVKWGGGTTPQVYVRKVGDAQSWLAEGRLDVPGEPLGWVERQILNIPRERVRNAAATHPDGQTFIVARASPTDANFAVQGVPEGRELTSPGAGDGFATTLSYLSMDDVAAAEQRGLTGQGVAPGFEAGPTAAFTMFDGMIITVRTAKKDGKTWAGFAATAPPDPPAPGEAPADQAAPADAQQKSDELKKEATDLNLRLANWAFLLPEYKAKSLSLHIDELLKPPAQPTPTPVEQPASPVPQPAPG